MMAHAFIVGETIEAAIARGRTRSPTLALCSFDMLGEGARTEADAERYFDAYAHAIEALSAPGAGTGARALGDLGEALGARAALLRCMQSARVNERTRSAHAAIWRARAARAGIGFTIDAEEADRLDLSLDIMETLARDRDDPRLGRGSGLRCRPMGAARRGCSNGWRRSRAATGRRMSVRLVKGAYWDSEIKRAQERGLASFPVYTSKDADRCELPQGVQVLFAAGDVIYPQFATHNAYTVAAVLALAPARARRTSFSACTAWARRSMRPPPRRSPQLPPVRVYAPVGTHEELLPYLVRRLLENGANSSFVHQFLNPQIPVAAGRARSARCLEWARRARARRASASRMRSMARSGPTRRARTSAIRRCSRRSS